MPATCFPPAEHVSRYCAWFVAMSTYRTQNGAWVKAFPVAAGAGANVFCISASAFGSGTPAAVALRMRKIDGELAARLIVQQAPGRIDCTSNWSAPVRLPVTSIDAGVMLFVDSSVRPCALLVPVEPGVKRMPWSPLCAAVDPGGRLPT